MNSHPKSRISHLHSTEGSLLILAAGFLLCFAIALTIAPAVLQRSWEVAYQWDHWIGFCLWVLIILLAHRILSYRMPDHDPYLLPAAGLLAGWGLLTIWRLNSSFGIRQSVWVVIAVAVMTAGCSLLPNLSILRQYKYLWLTSGLLLTTLTLILGTNPTGTGPRLWLGCCGIYLQPSEPLKLLLIVYLAAYFADQQRLFARLVPLIAPTIAMAGISLILLFVQRDLGTASILLVLYTCVVYVATGRKRLLAVSAFLLVLSGIAGYVLFDVVRIRIEAWINPWVDPSNRSYQIVQSLLAVAAGGLVGRGPGLGSPTLVPVQHSDFIFASIAEETGLVGTLGLIALIALITSRGLRVALFAKDDYHRYLAAGLTVYLAVQSSLIVGGNIRLLPLTGVTLPFVSYGGSSLVTSFIALMLLLHVSSDIETGRARAVEVEPLSILGFFLFSGLLANAAITGWWAYYRAPALLTRTDNLRRVIADQYVRRGSLVDRADIPLNSTTGDPGEYLRVYSYPPLSPLLGYNDPVYGQAGLERELDPFLRGAEGRPSIEIWWSQLLYGQPPPGLDVRLSINLNLQRQADAILEGSPGALVLLNAKSGELLVAATHPNFDPNHLEETWSELLQNQAAPLFNRVTLGRYPPGPALAPLILATVIEEGILPPATLRQNFPDDSVSLTCAHPPKGKKWSDVIAAGCPDSIAALAQDLSVTRLNEVYQEAGLYDPVGLLVDTEEQGPKPIQDDSQIAATGSDRLLISPFQLALATASISANGHRPAGHIVTAVERPEGGWMDLPALGVPDQIFNAEAAQQTAEMLAVEDMPIWQIVSRVDNQGEGTISWHIAGTLPDWQGDRLVMVLMLENAGAEIVVKMGHSMMTEVFHQIND